MGDVQQQVGVLMTPADACDWLEERIPYTSGPCELRDREALAIVDASVKLADLSMRLWGADSEDDKAPIRRAVFQACARLRVLTAGADA
jgi:hypothetical protein